MGEESQANNPTRVQQAWNKVNKVASDCGAIDDLYVCACIHVCVYGYVCCVGEGG